MTSEFFEKSSSVPTSCGSAVNYYSRGLETVSPDNPILILVHGYPQSAYMYRHVVSRLPPDVPIFIPDLPGYGNSTPPPRGDKRTVGAAVLEALEKSLPSSGPISQKIILCGHDRGARVCHRLAVDAEQHSSTFSLVSVIFLDIVPTSAQFETFGNSASSVGTFHWPLLANVELATKMILATGGGWWCQAMIERWAGKNEHRLKGLKGDDAMERYCGYFERESVVRASCEDYRAGAFEDVELQKEDQQQGRKIAVPTLVVYSSAYLGARYDMEKVWKGWVQEGANLKVEGIGDGAGHFLPEEAPVELSNIMISWISQFS
ncbi:alpha/beta-hydrolase [Rhizodiscina lignyota]|uniref:Alpha/beta-hydrolase n=1 Tax=Rhizodiscina lignyota TaxID=1504668 RepID=A0A9P4IIZ1_9PEZI|nr:alpha/beta-hydrolase [Rhizodiscina lignyota]